MKHCFCALLILTVVALHPLIAGELRTWTSRDGQFTLSAELLRVEGDEVVLRKSDGSTITVAIDKLSDGDGRFIGDFSAKQGLPPVLDATEDVAAAPMQVTPAAVESVAASCRSPREALAIYRAYYAAFPAPTQATFSVDSGLTRWQQLTEQRQLRLGRNWMPQDKYDEVRQQARQLIVSAIQQLQEQAGDKARNSLAEAARIDPESAIANDIIGLTYAVSLRNYEQAKNHFTEAIRRDPLDPTAANNLGIVEFRMGNSTAAVTRWLQAVEIAPTSKEILHNLLHFLEEIDKKSIAEPSSGMTSLRALQKNLTERGVADPFANTGWLYLPPTSAMEDSIGPTPNAELDRRFGPGRFESGRRDTTIYVGQRTGFVVAPNHVLTYVDRLESSGEFHISKPSDSPLQPPQRAHVVAYDDGTGLLLLRAGEIGAPPLPWAEQFPRAGTNLAIAGFAKPTHFTDSRSVVRCTLVSTPTADSGNLFLCSAKTLLGLGASPIADSTGGCIGAAVLNQRLGRPTMIALDARVVSNFLSQQLPDYRPARAASSQQTWDIIDARLLDSLVLIETRMALRSDYCTGLRKSAGVDTLYVSDGSVLEDIFCNRCRGVGAVNCPVRGCANGGILVEIRTEIGSANGQTLYRFDKVRRPCDVCNGRGKVSCPACNDGRAPGLSR